MTAPACESDFSDLGSYVWLTAFIQYGLGPRNVRTTYVLHLFANIPNIIYFVGLQTIHVRLDLAGVAGVTCALDCNAFCQWYADDSGCAKTCHRELGHAGLVHLCDVHDPDFVANFS